ncbi:alpha/beta fold hydrolase [Reyranella sp.]|uniref:alpha/beta fold hydrolase n=1 Tax=Reyranella sp. TaxID=1929291 RepID=UPI003BAD9A7B
MEASPPGQRRLGPRPLPLHLGTALMTWASSESALKLWKPDSASSRPGSTQTPAPGTEPGPGPAPETTAPDTIPALLVEARALEARSGSGRFEDALRREIGRRLRRLADGVLAYRDHPVRRTLVDPPPVWAEGSTRLLDYGATHRSARVRGARAVLVVPSLINRWEVLDLTAEKSLLRAMAARGLRPYLVDWGTPDAHERGFDLAAYVGRLERAASFVARRARRAPAVMGYCMGGTLAVALAARRPRRVAGLALLAAPWDFEADRTGHAFLLSAGPLLAEMADRVGELPVDILQTLFWSLDPWLAVKKFSRFLGMAPNGQPAQEFVLLEDWLNGGAPLAGPAARECLVDWYGANLPGTGRWVVDGRRIVPARIRVPSLVMIPSGDRIVPPPSAAALVDPRRGLRRATRVDVPLGHIGMVVSGRARDLCWTPLLGWLADIPAKRR